MNSLHFDIGDMQDRVLNIHAFFARHIPFVVKKILKFSLKTGVYKKLNRRLSKTLIFTEGLKKVSRDIQSKERAAKVREMAQEMLFDYIRLHAAYEKASFFNNNETKELVESAIDNLHDTEVYLRRKAFSDKPLPQDDEHLRSFASEISLSSISAH